MIPEGTCTRCDAGVRIVITVGGRRRELETTPHEDGNHVLEEVSVANGTWLRARVLTGRELPALETAYRMHQCPKPDRRPPLLCRGCRGPMNRDLVDADVAFWASHPDRELGQARATQCRQFHACCDPADQQAHIRQITRQARDHAA